MHERTAIEIFVPVKFSRPNRKLANTELATKITFAVFFCLFVVVVVLLQFACSDYHIA